MSASQFIGIQDILSALHWDVEFIKKTSNKIAQQQFLYSVCILKSLNTTNLYKNIIATFQSVISADTSAYHLLWNYMLFLTLTLIKSSTIIAVILIA